MTFLDGTVFFCNVKVGRKEWQEDNMQSDVSGY